MSLLNLKMESKRKKRIMLRWIQRYAVMPLRQATVTGRLYIDPCRDVQRTPHWLRYHRSRPLRLLAGLKRPTMQGKPIDSHDENCFKKNVLQYCFGGCWKCLSLTSLASRNILTARSRTIRGNRSPLPPNPLDNRAGRSNSSRKLLR